MGELARHIAGVLRAEVARQQISQSALAAAVGLSQSQVSKYLTGKKAPNVDELEALCLAVGRSYLDVVTEAEDQAAGTIARGSSPRARAEQEDLRRAIERTRPEPRRKGRPEANTG